MSNLYKSRFLNISEKPAYVLNVESIVEKRIQELQEQQAQHCGEEEDDGLFTEGLNADEVANLLTSDPDEAGGDELQPLTGNVIKASNAMTQEEADAIIAEAVEQANAQATEIVEEARKEADSIRQKAHREGFEAGEREGRHKSETILQQKQAQMDALQKELEEEYARRIDDIEPQLVEAITEVYSHVFHVDLSSRKDMVVQLVKDSLRGAESQTGFLIHVAKEDYPFVTMQKKEIASVIPGDTPLDVIEDLTLQHNECFIEMGSGIYDCGLDTQLGQLKKELQILSYRKNN